MYNEEKKVWVIGHKNPDTDSICSAISYAYLKNQINSDRKFEPKRAGEVNEETRYVLNTFGVDAPQLETDASAQVKDIEIRDIQAIGSDMSLKQAWETMKKSKAQTLPVVDDSRRLIGLITVNDIARAYMDIYDNHIISKAKTPYKNVIDTLGGKIVCGDENAVIEEGKVVIGTADPEIMKNFMDEHDILIIGNRQTAWECAINSDVSAVIVPGDAEVDQKVIDLANEHHVTIIATPYDTFTTARLINQSMPIGCFMRKDDIISFDVDEYIYAVREVMSKERHHDFPVLDMDGRYVGIISRRNLLNMQKKQIILVDHNEKSQTVDGIDGADILEIIDHHRIGSLETASPVYFRNEPLGCSATIVYQMYQENHVEVPKKIAGLLCSAILSDTLMFRSPTCTPKDQEVAEKLAEIAGINVEEHAKAMFKAGSDFKGKTAEEIFYQDFKVFQTDHGDFGVGQISAMTQDELEEVKEKLLPYMPNALADRDISKVYMMLTNILEETTYLIAYGEQADELVEKAFHVKKDGDYFILKDVVSRKKQMIPNFMAAIPTLD